MSYGRQDGHHMINASVPTPETAISMALRGKNEAVLRIYDACRNRAMATIPTQARSLLAVRTGNISLKHDKAVRNQLG